MNKFKELTNSILILTNYKILDRNIYYDLTDNLKDFIIQNFNHEISKKDDIETSLKKLNKNELNQTIEHFRSLIVYSVLSRK